jgi:hypothetical protein
VGNLNRLKAIAASQGFFVFVFGLLYAGLIFEERRELPTLLTSTRLPKRSQPGLTSTLAIANTIFILHFSHYFFGRLA